jgi:hypothetical protein
MNVTSRRVIALVISVFTALPGVLAASEPGGNLKYLNNNKWTPEEREKFYHTSEGPFYMGVRWFESLEAPDSKTDAIKLFGTAETFRRYGLIVDPSINPRDGLPDGLPVGFVISKEKVPRFGLTCAGCHTGMMEYKGQAFLIDGGAPLTDLKRFIGDIYRTLGVTLKNEAVLPDGTTLPDEQKFARFAQKVLAPANPSQKDIKKLWDEIADAIKTAREIDGPDEYYPLTWGYGRLDAFGRGGNTLLVPLSSDNFWPADAPVSFPALWGAYDYMWVQWNGSINQPMARNISQAITGSPRMEYKDPADPYKSKIDVKILHELEQLTRKLTPPQWPKGHFEKAEDNKAFEIDFAVATDGKALFKDRCAGCHVPKYSETKQYKKKFLDLNVIALNFIGTDPAHATRFGDRQVVTGMLDKGTIRAKDYMKLATTEIRNQRYVEQDVRKEKYAEMDGFRENEWRAEKCESTKDGKGKACSPGYIARPLAGIWATAPFLHNGSVPNLYELLSPLSERSSCFYLGHHEFDPKNVGYTLKKCKGDNPPKGSVDRAYYESDGFRFVTSLKGNSNTGHEFSDSGKDEFKGPLSDPQRKAIIEYLKTCDLQDPKDGTPRDKIWWEENKDKRPIVCTDKYAATAK